MHNTNNQKKYHDWCVNKIAVVGPGIVGMPMAALLANARICEGSNRPAKVIVIQRNSQTSGWKVDAINSGHSPIGGIEPDLDQIVKKTHTEGLLSASNNYSNLKDADVILVCVQTDKKGFGPDYEPLFEALRNIAESLKHKPVENIPLIIFESTLAPSSMITVIKEFFEGHGLLDGRDIMLGNSPNRVMPGRLVQRVINSDKIVAGLNHMTPKLIKRLYSKIVTNGNLYCTNSLTAEVVKTFENAYRDVRIAYATEIVRFCDEHDIDFYQVRQKVNSRLSQSDIASYDINVVPTGGILIPNIGVGGHCLPKDGILLWWRKSEARTDTSSSIIWESRHINEESPASTIHLAEQHFGDMSGKRVALLGAAYRANSEDTRNSPTLAAAIQLIKKGCNLTIHDPYVKSNDQNLIKFGLQNHFTQDLSQSLTLVEYIIFCTSHRIYANERENIIQLAPQLKGIMDACNLYNRSEFLGHPFDYTGIGRGLKTPSQEFLDFVYEGFRCVEHGIANELYGIIDFLNEQYAHDEFNKIDFMEVQKIAGTCITGCAIADPRPIKTTPVYNGFSSRLVRCAQKTVNCQSQIVN